MMIFNSFTVTNDYNPLARNDLTAVTFLADKYNFSRHLFGY